MLDVHTVGAGGGSIAWRDPGGALRAGPRSAGARPGPACYGHGGTEPTVTDANLVLGLLAPGASLGGEIELDRDLAAEAVGKLADSLGLDLLDCAEGIRRVSNAEMVRALRVMTVERGVDPRELALLAFGGAGALHAADIADELGMDRILCPRAAGVLAALGLVVSERRRDAQRSVLLSGDELTAETLATEAGELAERARGELGAPEAGVRVTAELRYRGQAFELAVDAGERPDPEKLREAFHSAHEEAYGFRDDEGEVELVTLRATATEPGPDVDAAAAGAAAAGVERSTRRARFGGEEHEAEVITGEPEPGTELTGPAIVELPEATLAVPPGLGRRGARVRHDPAGAGVVSVDPITLRVVSGALRAACEEMGAVLVKAAHSANIKERRDASCALFDRDGNMVMQAEHIPVHLGAMPDAVAAVAGEDHSDGTPWVLNDPFAGGTHLPDITVITPALVDGELLGFAASRAHHADVGGPTPGSMPADSTSLDDEGVVIEPQPLDDDALERLAAEMRQPAQRRADLRAQLAANRTGAKRLAELRERLGADGLDEAMTETIDYAERRMRACLEELEDGTYEARDVLEAADGDLELKLTATVSGDELTLDFEGTDPQHGGNLNCPLAVTRSACWFAVRVLTDPDIPPASGAMRPGHRPGARGQPAQRPPPRRGRGGQRGDLLARRRPRAGRVRPRARPGHDEQPHARLGRLRLLRDARRRPGRVPGRRRPERRARRDVEHAQHAGRGARARVPAAGGPLRAAPRLRRRREAPRRRRRRPRAGGARRHAVLAAHRAPPPRPAGRGRRQAGRAGPQPARRRGAGAQGER